MPNIHETIAENRITHSGTDFSVLFYEMKADDPTIDAIKAYDLRDHISVFQLIWENRPNTLHPDVNKLWRSRDPRKKSFKTSYDLQQFRYIKAARLEGVMASTRQFASRQPRPQLLAVAWLQHQCFPAQGGKFKAREHGVAPFNMSSIRKHLFTSSIILGQIFAQLHVCLCTPCPTPTTSQQQSTDSPQFQMSTYTTEIGGDTPQWRTISSSAMIGIH